MEKNYIYRVTEANVDGCGGSATEFVCFPAELTAALQAKFEQCLGKAKENARGHDVDTTDMIHDAVVAFENETGIPGHICDAPYEGGFEF